LELFLKPPEPNYSTRILVVVLAYEAKTTITNVIKAIVATRLRLNLSILVLDDCSSDHTFLLASEFANTFGELQTYVLRNNGNQGYGGNQKIAFQFALDRNFDIVVVMHGDEQHDAAELSKLLAPILCEEADLVIGARLLNRWDAIRNGMPLYKWLGNQILTAIQNAILHTHLRGFHCGYRAYSKNALLLLSPSRCSNGFIFDTEMLIKAHAAGLRIRELSVRTIYGMEVCRVNGLHYAWDVIRTMLAYRAYMAGLLHESRFEEHPIDYPFKDSFVSSHTLAILAAKPKSSMLDIGCGSGQFAKQLLTKASHVTCIDKADRELSCAGLDFIHSNIETKPFPVDASKYDQIFLLDVIEHLSDPEGFLEQLRYASGLRRPEIIITTPNIAFILIRGLLLLGWFEYSRYGILDRTHTRLFTVRSLRRVLKQAGYKILEEKGIPAPFTLLIKSPWLAKTLTNANKVLLRLWKGLFSYQIFIRAEIQPCPEWILKESIDASRSKEPASRKQNR
jgi:glycosyltransferase involved in cell wall biosynthesis